MERIDLPPTTQPANGGVPTTLPAVPPVAASAQDEPKPPPAPTFDPATYRGPLNTLSPEQRQQVIQYRNNLARQQMQQRQQQLQQQQQQPSNQRK